MTSTQRNELLRILIAGALFAVALLLPLSGIWQWIAFLVPYLVAGGDVLWKAARRILRGQVFDEHFLMSLASIGAMVIGEYPEGVAVMLFYQVGEWFQDYAVGRSRRSISALMNIRPDRALVERDNTIIEVSPEEVAVGEVMVIKAGEKVPLDGVVLEGHSTLDTAALTGESLPCDVAPGDPVASGCVNQTGLLRVQVTRPFAESTVSKILDLVENAAGRKATAEHFITKFARYYTPCVVIGAALLTLLPPLLMGGGWSQWIHRALIFLVISCPCALVISVPLSFFGGIGGASRHGILIKGGNYLEVLADTDTMVFDKTGTLTQGVFQVSDIHPQTLSAQRLLELAAIAESVSDHPISRSLQEAYGQDIQPAQITTAEERAGRGICAVVDGHTVCVGNDTLMQEMGVTYPPCSHIGTIVHVSVDGEYAGHIVIADRIKPDAKDAIATLKAMGIRRTVMLTGDTAATGEAVAQKLGVDDVYTRLLPCDKVTKVEQLLQDATGKGTLAFVGDGINDAPVLCRADVGIAMGGIGSDAAIEAADIVLMDDQPSKIAVAIRIAQYTRRIVRQNIVFALGVKALIMLLGALGIANMWAAVFADVGVSVLAVFNAMRTLKVKN